VNSPPLKPLAHLLPYQNLLDFEDGLLTRRLYVGRRNSITAVASALSAAKKNRGIRW
jgi:hypothetical protein